MHDTTIGCVPPDVARALTGLELIQGIVEGKYPRPPILQSFDFSLDRVEPGIAVCSGVAKPDYYNPLGSVQGGWITALLDASMGCAVHGMLPAGSSYTTVELKVSFIRP